jgi:hypothetical protein
MLEKDWIREIRTAYRVLYFQIHEGRLLGRTGCRRYMLSQWFSET